jgi:ceramide glucosyltransferase
MTIAFLAALLSSVLLYAACLLSLKRHRRGFRECPPDWSLGVSIIKPLAGLDARLEENLESFFRVDYPSYEIVFSFASSTDPAFAVARRVADRHPTIPTVFVVDGREPGRNSKVNRLVAGVRVARNRLYLFSDGDVRVARDFLSRAVSTFSDPSVGLASHLFRGSGEMSLGSRLEGLYLAGVLRPGTVATTRILRKPCVVGKAILVSRRALDAIGGLAPLRDRLAEDFLLGRLVAGAGYRVVLSADELETELGSKSLRSVWDRHRRWAILRRRLGGFSYAAEALASPAVFVAGAVIASRGSPAVSAAALLLWLVRIGLEVSGWRRGGEAPKAADLLLLPLRDLAVAALFWAGLTGSETRWRGRAMRIGADTLIGVTERPSGV